MIFGCSNHRDNEYHKFISLISDYQSKIEIIYTENDATIDTSTFDIEDYFTLFDKLSIDSLYKLDYYYLLMFRS